MDLGSHDTHLYQKITFGIREGAYRSFEIQTQYFHTIAQMQIGRLQITCDLLFFPGHIAFDFVHLLTEILSFIFHFFNGNIGFSEFVKVFDRLIRIFFCITEDCMCLLVGFPEDPVTLLVQFFLLGLQLFFQIFDFGLVAGNLHAFFFDGDTVFFQGGDHILEGLVFLADLFFCIIDNIRWQSQLTGNGKGITLSGNTDQ